jgi:hypothetical protein
MTFAKAPGASATDEEKDDASKRSTPILSKSTPS